MAGLYGSFPERRDGGSLPPRPKTVLDEYASEPTLGMGAGTQLAEAPRPGNDRPDDGAASLPYPPKPRPNVDMIQRLEGYLQHPNVRGLLDTIAEAEGGDYDRLFGFKTFSDYSQFPGFGRHPSSASGRYQINAQTFNELSGELGLADFSPHTQDLMAARLLEKQGAIDPLLRGNLDAVLPLITRRWASLPASKTAGGHYEKLGQIAKPYEFIQSAFERNRRHRGYR